jgi:protein-tyrosine-phosphatase
LAQGTGLPGAVLFTCSRNGARSPMAEAIFKHLAGRQVYVDSAGVSAGTPDPFAAAALEEIGIDVSGHRPKALSELTDLAFDLIVALSPEAHHAALQLAQGHAIGVEYWPTPDPSLTEGSREQILEAYRALRDDLVRRIKARFALTDAGENESQNSDRVRD